MTIDTTVNLGQYGVSFQRKVFQAMLMDSKWAEILLEVFDPSYFDQKYLVYLADRYFTYAKKYKVFPSIGLLVTIIKDELKKGSDLILKDQVVNYLTEIKANPNPGDLEFVKEKSLDFCRKQALKLAIGQAVDHMASQDENYEQIVEIIKKAVMVGTAPSVGHDFFEDYEARFSVIARNVIPTGISQLDKKEILQGGLGRGELGIVIGATGAGKSHYLVEMGCAALKAGMDVIHYTLELSETQVGVRYDSNLCAIDSNLILDNKEKILERYKDKTLGRLIIKQYPTGSPTVYTLKSHIERLKVQKGFNPALVVIDYADIMRSTRKFDSLRHELKLVYEELRGLASELNVAIWSASQSNKEGANSEVIDMTNMSEAYGKAMISDFIVSISRKAHEKSSGHGRLYIAKNRAGRDGLMYPLLIDTAQSRFTITGDVSQPNQNPETDEQSFKKALAKRFADLKNDESLVISEKTQA